VGRLPFFTASTTALVVLPIYFYVIGIYNQHLTAWKAALSKDVNASIIAQTGRYALSHLKELPIPNLSLQSLAAAMLLLIASSIYLLACPARVKQFSSSEWCDEFNKPIILYWAHSWRFPILRMICVATYFLGGGLAAWVIVDKLLITLRYVWENAPITFWG
jgi:hypothetical protein